MPGLVIFNRRWGIGSDDFVYPGIAEIFLRFVWLVAISIVFHLHQNVKTQCNDAELLEAYYIGVLTLLTISLILTTCMVYISMQGSITNSYPRKKITKILYIKIGLSIPELIWNCIGTYWSFGLSSGCEIHVVRTVQGAVISGWVLVAILLIGLAVVFDPLGGSQKRTRTNSQLMRLESSSRDQFIETAKLAAQKTWERRCKLLCCCVACDDQNKDAFSDIASLLTEFFQGVDLVATDIAAGLILVQREQDIQAGQLTTVVTEDNRTRDNHPSSGYETFSSILSAADRIPSLPVNSNMEMKVDPEFWMNTTLMTHYMKYAMASYGWPLYIFGNLTTGLCMLCGQCRLCEVLLSCCNCWRSDQHVYEDNCCQCNTSAVRRWTDIYDGDLLYCSFHNEIYEIPFFVAIDRKEKSVVVSVRGTLSLQDALTDLTADCEPLDIENHEDCLAHKGILQAAMYVKRELEHMQLLEKAFQQIQGARLVVTGHSLGAGAAALLSILLRPSYPDLLCFAFSPPGGLLSYNASCYSSDFICSVVLGKDLVPRLGIRSMENLKTRTLQAIRNCEYPKYRVLASGVLQAFCCMCGKDSGSTNPDQPLLNEAHYAQRNVEESIQDAIQQSEQCRITFPRLYPPGQMLYIMEVDSDKGCCTTPTYYAEWRTAADFQEIIVGPDMISDHLPDNVLRALTQLSSKNFTPKSHTNTQSTATTV